MPKTAPSIQPDDGSILTPDITPEALAPEPAPTGSEPNVGKLANLLGEHADARHVALVGLFVLAVVYTLHLAQAFVLPIVLAVLLDFMLSPLVRALKKRRIPEPVGAGLIILGLLGALGAGGWYLAEPAADWIRRVPESTAAVQRKLQTMRGSVEQVTHADEQVEKATEMATRDDVRQVEIKGPSLTTQLFGGTASFLSGATVVLFLTYFLLAVGDLFLQKLVAVLPQFKDKKTAVTIARETEAQISVYLFTSTMINIGVGVVTAVAMWLVGMPNAALWGVVAALLNFVPYVGPLTGLATVGVVSILAGQTFLNLMVCLKLMPVTGVTLPFVSYGGSSLLASFMAAGLLLNIGQNRPHVMARESFEY